MMFLNITPLKLAKGIYEANVVLINQADIEPEPLKYNWSGYWSRRITIEHRLVYKVTDDSILIAQCRYHY